MDNEQHPNSPPEGYFEGFYDRLKDRLDAEDAQPELPVEHGFRVPEGYFRQFPERILGIMKAEQTVEGIPERDGFQVPDGYFKELPGRMAAVASEHASVRVISLNHRQWLGSFAAVAAAVVLIWNLGFRADGTTTELDFNNLAEAEVKDYLETYYLDELAYSELSSGIQWKEDDWEQNVEMLSESTLSEEELYQYLNETLDYEETLNWSYETQ